MSLEFYFKVPFNRVGVLRHLQSDLTGGRGEGGGGGGVARSGHARRSATGDLVRLGAVALTATAALRDSEGDSTWREGGRVTVSGATMLLVKSWKLRASAARKQAINNHSLSIILGCRSDPSKVHKYIHHSLFRPPKGWLKTR